MPKNAPNFSPKSLRTYGALFPGKLRPLKIHQQSPQQFSMPPQSPGESVEKFSHTKSFGRATRQSDFFCFLRVLSPFFPSLPRRSPSPKTPTFVGSCELLCLLELLGDRVRGGVWSASPHRKQGHLLFFSPEGPRVCQGISFVSEARSSTPCDTRPTGKMAILKLCIKWESWAHISGVP